MKNTFGVRRLAFGVHKCTLAFLLFLMGVLPSIVLAAEAAPVSAHGNAERRTPNAEPSLVPIADTLRTVQLDALAAVPVQHGGRYKPLHTLAMEAADGVGGTLTLGPGHTPLSGLLDLLFCHADYRNRPIVKVKHAELAQDLAVALPPAEQELLKKERRISPERLQDGAVQAELERLGRLTTKAKSISQVRTAAFWADHQELLAAARLYPLPSGAHADHWRAPSDVAPPFAGALADFLVRAAAAQGAMAGFTLSGSTALPLDDQLARQLRLSAEDQRRVNMEVLWPLWKAAGGGRFKAEVARTLVEDPAQTRALTGCDEAVAAGLAQLKERWAEVGLAAEDCADATQKPAIDAALARATAAWAGLAHGWSQARHGQPAPGLQGHIDALVAATQELRGLLDRDRAARGWKPLHIDPGLEMTYWRWKGFSGVAWLFLFAVPLLALGSLGRSRWALWLGLGLFAVGFAGQAAAFLIRWQLAERIPLANLYESMAAAATLASLVALPIEAVLAWRTLRGRPSAVAGSLALAAVLFGCIIALALAFLERHEINAFISPAMPILSDFWMRIHVACVVASYGIIGLGGVMSVVYLAMRVRLPWNDDRALAWDRSTFAMNGAAMVMLWAGLVLGAVWAAVSWGRPWGWDPKEVFALLTWIVFIILVHLRILMPPERRGVATALVSLGAFLVMGFNWYFVNVKLAGLHSYA